MSKSKFLKLPTGTWIGRAWPHAAAYPVCFGLLRGSLLLLWSRLWPRSRAREIKVVAPNSGAPLVVRLATSDVMVFNDIYRRQAYEWDLRYTPSVIIDAGAYTGLSTAFFASRYPDSVVIAIEPDEANFELLVRNTRSYKNVHQIHAALWAESGYVSLVDPGEGAWSLRLLESQDSSVAVKPNLVSGSDAVRAVTITDIIRDYGLEKIDLLKIDVEGSEKEIFASADSWINSVDAVCLELHDRFKAGCSRAFFKAVEDFPIERWRGEDVLVMRETI
jgi:FkbM family methyltransferase